MRTFFNRPGWHFWRARLDLDFSLVGTQTSRVIAKLLVEKAMAGFKEMEVGLAMVKQLLGLLVSKRVKRSKGVMHAN